MITQSFTFAPSTVKALEKIKSEKGINKSRFVETAVIIYMTIEKYAPDQAGKLLGMIDPNQVDMMAALDKAIKTDNTAE